MAKGSHLPPAPISGRGQPYSVLVLLSLNLGHIRRPRNVGA